MFTNSFPMSAGCYVDGHHGQYAVDGLAALADNLLGTSFLSNVLKARSSEDWDALVDEGDRAMDALNDQTTGGYWEWCEGEVFLTPFDE